jgi:uncharacterized protein (DUF362 family)
VEEGVLLSKSVIGIAKTPPSPDRQEIAAAVRRAVELAGGLPEQIKAGAKVLLKPNLVEIPRTREGGAVTHPQLCRAVAEMVQERGAFPIIADSAGVGSDTESVIAYMGYGLLRQEGFMVLDLKKTGVRRIHNPGASVMPHLGIFEPALEADAIINLPVMKTHDQVELTLGMKNLKGLLDDATKKMMHRRGVVRGVVETAAFFRPCLTVLDGIYCQEGVGPVYGDPVEMDLVIAGRDMVAVDSAAGMIMGYRPDEVPITREAAARGLGSASLNEYEIKGLPLADILRPFKRCSQSEILTRELPCALFMPESACTGCRNTVIAVLVELQEKEMLLLLSGKAVIAGHPPGHLPDGKLVLVGTCTKPLRKQGTYIEGCPPENSWIARALVDTGKES